MVEPKAKLYVFIEADTNDADYTARLTKISEKDIPLITKVAKLIKKCPDNHNWPTTWEGDESPEELYIDSGKLTEDEFCKFEDYVPTFEHGIHTITQIKIVQMVKSIL